MSSFEPNKRHLRELLIYFFNLKKSAAEAHRLLVEAYGEAALSERSCREWFQKFKNGEFHIEDKEGSGSPKVYEDMELEALLDQDSCQTQFLIKNGGNLFVHQIIKDTSLVLTKYEHFHLRASTENKMSQKSPKVVK